MVGERILGRFRVERRLGSGGFGTVYAAWDERLRRSVAVKVIERPGQAERVAREAQAAARLTHRNIATLYELAVEDDRAYLVGELVEGRTLRARARSGELSDRSLAEVGAGAAAALAHAHRHGVIHRDVKPDNVLVPDAGGPPKLVDFGIARVAGEATLTASGAVLGTLAYMAPEQADGLRPGPAADVYSLAITLYECWSGEHPVALGAPAATARAIGEPIAPLQEVRPDLPPALCELVDRCLDPDPEERPLASELETALPAHAPALSGEPLPPLAELPGSDQSVARRSPPWLQRAAGALALAGLSLAVLAWAGAAAAVLAVISLVTFLLGLARPRGALVAASAGSVSWLLLGAGEPGAAALLLLLVAPLIVAPLEPGPALPLPALAPLLGSVGLAGAYPALAGLPSRAAERALLAASGYLWLAAAETISRDDLFIGGLEPAPANWPDSVSVVIGDLVPTIFGPAVLLGAAVWALAGLTLPLVVRGRFGALDLLGGVLWAASLVTAQRLLAGPGAESSGLLLVVVAAAGAVALILRRWPPCPPSRPGTVSASPGLSQSSLRA